MTKPLASLSLDLDNKWSYLKTHGDESWEDYPSYLETVVPHILSVLEDVGLQITFFVVGQDAAIPENYEALRSLVDAGHEIANHSFRHEPWLHLYDPQELEEELTKTEQALENISGQMPVGFRGPGFSCSPALLASLSRRGYLFDASKLPTFIGPLARAYYFFRSKLGRGEREDRNQLFGNWREVFCPIKPYWHQWQADAASRETDRLLEIPVTTMPFFRLPIHLSYLQYLLQYSERLAWFYWRMSMWLCRLARVEPSLLLHPLDFMDEEDEPQLAFFPGMRTNSTVKRTFLTRVLMDYAKSYQVVPMSAHARLIQQRNDLKITALRSSLGTPFVDDQGNLYGSEHSSAVQPPLAAEATR